MKILYGEGDFLESRHQIIAYPASVGGENHLPIETEVARRHPDARQSVFNMFAENENFAVVDMRWTISHTDSSPPNVFNTTYNIQKIDGEWKVNLVTAYSEKRLKKIDSVQR